MSAQQRTAPSPRTRVKRFHERGAYDHDTIQSILDAGIYCHVGFVHEGQPFVMPTLYWHDADNLYFHGSSASRMIKAAATQSVCVNVTHMDALVLTRSAFHHSANYRSVTILGKGRMIADPERCAGQLKTMMERLFPGRWDKLRPVTEKELKATRVIAVSLTEASAKVRTGPPDEEEDDLAWPVWGGLIPLRTVIDAAIADENAVKYGLSELPRLGIGSEKHG